MLAGVTGDYPWVVSLQHRAAALRTRAVTATGERARDEATVAWISHHRDALLAAGGIVALVILWVADLSWLGLLLVLALVTVYEVAVYRIGTPPETPSEIPPPEPPTPPRPTNTGARPVGMTAGRQGESAE